MSIDWHGVNMVRLFTITMEQHHINLIFRLRDSRASLQRIGSREILHVCAFSYANRRSSKIYILDVDMGKTAWQEMFEYHGRPSGIFAGNVFEYSIMDLIFILFLIQRMSIWPGCKPFGGKLFYFSLNSCIKRAKKNRTELCLVVVCHF
jgi:hypothetical protein